MPQTNKSKCGRSRNDPDARRKGPRVHIRPSIAKLAEQKAKDGETIADVLERAIQNL